MSDRYRVLVVVASSGDYPFLEIEEQGQRPTFFLDQTEFVKCVWIEGDSLLARKRIFRCLDRLMEPIHRNLYSHPIELVAWGYLYFVNGWRLMRERLPPESPQVQHQFRLRVNWSFFLGRTYSVQKNRNSFSRLLARILSFLADGTTRVFGNRVSLNFPNSYFLGPWRSYLRYEVVLRHFKFDFVLFTTSTCYVDLETLAREVELLPAERVYAGHLMNVFAPFIAGNSVLMSRDVVKSVVRNKRHYRLDVPDDVALGILIRDCDLADRISVPTETLPFGAKIPEDLSQDLRQRYVYRCKAQPTTLVPEPVVQTMHELHEHIVRVRQGNV